MMLMITVMTLMMMENLFCVSMYGLPHIVVPHLRIWRQVINAILPFQEIFMEIPLFARNFSTSTTDSGFTMYLLRTPCLSSLVSRRVL